MRLAFPVGVLLFFFSFCFLFSNLVFFLLFYFRTKVSSHRLWVIAFEDLSRDFRHLLTGYKRGSSISSARFIDSVGKGRRPFGGAVQAAATGGDGSSIRSYRLLAEEFVF